MWTKTDELLETRNIKKATQCKIQKLYSKNISSDKNGINEQKTL